MGALRQGKQIGISAVIRQVIHHPFGAVREVYFLHFLEGHPAVQHHLAGHKEALELILVIAQAQLVQAVLRRFDHPFHPLAHVLPAAAADGVQPHLRRMVGLGEGGGAVIGGIDGGGGFAQGVFRLQNHFHTLHRGQAGIGRLVLFVRGQLFLRLQCQIIQHRFLAQGGQGNFVVALLQLEQHLAFHLVGVRQQCFRPQEGFHLLRPQLVAGGRALRLSGVHPDAIERHHGVGRAVGLAVHLQGVFHVHALTAFRVIADPQPVRARFRGAEHTGDRPARGKAHHVLPAFVFGKHLAVIGRQRAFRRGNKPGRIGPRLILRGVRAPLRRLNAVVPDQENGGHQKREAPHHGDCNDPSTPHVLHLREKNL